MGLEKIVQSCAKRFLVVADYRKQSKRLGTFFPNLPLEVVPAAYVPLKKRVEDREGGECILRMAKAKAGPVITDNGNYVLDWNFPKTGPTPDWAALHSRLKLMPGTVFIVVGVYIKIMFRYGRNGSVYRSCRASIFRYGRWISSKMDRRQQETLNELFSAWHYHLLYRCAIKLLGIIKNTIFLVFVFI